MLRALGQLSKAAGLSASYVTQLEAATALRGAGPASTLSSLRLFSAGEAPSHDAEDAGASTSGGSSSGSGGSSSGSGGRAGRLQTKEWRSWIDTKLDSKLEGELRVDEALASGWALSPAAATAAGLLPVACTCHSLPVAGSNFLSQAYTALLCLNAAAAIGQQAEEGPTAAAAAPAEPAAQAAAAAEPRAKKASGWELEQQIYSIVGGARPVVDATMPEGVTSFAQLAMASDAPRFARSGAHIADISPQRLHPTRLFFPEQTYSPAVRG